MKEKLAKYQKSKPKPPVERVAKLPPGFKSKAHRPKEAVDSSVGTTIVPTRMPDVTPEEEEARLTTEQITEGVNKAKEAMNAPPLDLIAFEE